MRNMDYSWKALRSTGKKWKKISESFGTKNALQVKHHGHGILDKEKESAIKQSTAEEHWSFSRGRWTEEEHRLYLNGFEEHGKKWEKIANAIKTRTLSQVKAYGHRHLKEQVDMKFSKKAGEEDFTSKEVKSCIR